MTKETQYNMLIPKCVGIKIIIPDIENMTTGEKTKGGKIFVCECGNSDQSKFHKFYKKELKIMNGRQQHTDVLHVMCDADIGEGKSCRVSVPYSDILVQISSLTPKKWRHKTTNRAKSKPLA